MTFIFIIFIFQNEMPHALNYANSYKLRMNPTNKSDELALIYMMGGYSN